MIFRFFVCLLALAASTLARPPLSGALVQRQIPASSTSASQTSSVLSGHVSLGCIVDDSARVMNKTWTMVRSVDECARIGRASGRRYFGIEAGNECFVADIVSKRNLATGCDRPCPSGGLAGECGGHWRMNLYDFSSSYTTTSSSPTSSSPTVSPSIPPISSGYAYQGCIGDTSSRAINQTWMTSSTMTIAACSEVARTAGKRYFGLQNGNQCFVSNALAFRTSSTRCTKECAGDKTAICGGNWAISLYTWNDQSASISSTSTSAVITTRATSTFLTSSSSAAPIFSQYSTCAPATTTSAPAPVNTATVCYDWFCPPRLNATIRPAVEAIWDDINMQISCR